MTITARIDAITGIPASHRGACIPAPRSVKIELTAACNYRCGFCVKSIRENSGEMDRTFYSRIIRELRDVGVEELGVFYIGESFVCKWLPDAIAEAKYVGFPYVFLTTNASAATPARVEACMKAGLDSLKFSLNFTDSAQFKSVAQVNPALYRKALQNIKDAKAVRDGGGYSCRLYASSIAFDGDQGDKMRALVDEMRPFVDEHYWLPLFNMNGASEASGMKPTQGNPGRLGNMREPLPCWSVATEGHITVDGKLSACCFGVGMEDDLVMGDLKTTRFMDAWNSPAFMRLRQAHILKDVTGTPCEKCIGG